VKEQLTPRDIVAELNRYIVGQTQAKRSVAIAIRNRWRRKLLPPHLKKEVYPKNILMIGPTGVGKTEIARRISQILNAPFIKVEATKYTEVGYVGRDVESIIRDLTHSAYEMLRGNILKEKEKEIIRRSCEEILRILPGLPVSLDNPQPFLTDLERGKYDTVMVEIEAEETPKLPFEVIGIGPQMEEEMEEAFKGFFSRIFPRTQRKATMSLPNAFRYFREKFSQEFIDENELRRKAVEITEEEGIVFIDEVDKIARRPGEHGHGPDVSGEGVQRDLLPIVEGTIVKTRYGQVHTDYILFIAAGAFHLTKPSDLIPEFQGRFPIRVELEPLTAEDFVRILKEPENSLLKQVVALIETEGVKVVFEESAIVTIANFAYEMNQKIQDIGARRLHTILEQVLEELSFSAPELSGQTISITSSYVQERLKGIYEKPDLARYIL
jgi:ATP-dependent HslUV protease ATP-binding subunit HslU